MKTLRSLLLAGLVLAGLAALGWWSGSEPRRDAVTAVREATGVALESSRVDVGGVRLHVVQAGDPDGPPVLLLHGFPEFWYAWRDVVPPLVAAGYRVIVPDQRGYGDSDKPPEIADYAVDRLGDDAAGLLRALGHDDACVVAHDWGGGVAWNLALRHPERVRRLVVLGVGHPDASKLAASKEKKVSWYRTFFQIPWLPELTSRLGGWWMVSRMLRDTAAPGTFSDDELAQYRSAWDRDGAYGKMVNWYRANTGGAEGEPRRSAVPTLLLLAPADAFIPQDLAQTSLQLLDDGRIVALEEGTHWVIQERPDLVAQQVTAFCAEGRKPAAASAEEAVGPGSEDAAMAQADEVFLRAYQAAADDALQDLPMALLALGDRLVVYEHGQRKAEHVYLPLRYTQLKEVSHIGLGAWALADAADGQGGTTDLGKHLASRLRRRTSVVLQMLPETGFSEALLQRQREILEPSLALLDRLLRGEKVDAAAQLAFARSIAPAQLANAADAARAQLEAVNEVTKQILEGATPEQQRSLHVVVGGVHQARRENVLAQYFRRILHEGDGAERRVVYAEGVADEKGALALLQRHLLDVSIGEQFFGSKRRLQADLLGPAAEQILPTLDLPELPEADPRPY